MGQHQFHHIPVVENGLLKGIISDRLILSHLAKAESKKSLIETIMVEQVLTADVHTSIADISRAMLDEKVSCLPVIDQKLHLKGMITTSDILSLMIMSFPLDIYS
jgi:acetoin utilization protein AcuB